MNKEMMMDFSRTSAMFGRRMERELAYTKDDASHFDVTFDLLAEIDLPIQLHREIRGRAAEVARREPTIKRRWNAGSRCRVSLGLGLLFLLIFVHPFPVQAHPEELVQSFKDEANRQSAMPAEADRYGRPLWELDARVPFIGSPVHESMTITSISLSNVHGRGFQAASDEAYIHGVFWNDDPDDLLCPECNFLNLRKFDKRWGIAFAKRFTAAKERVRKEGSDGSQPIFKLGDGLLERSHFGDLQFLHGMASRNGEPAGETQVKMLAWAEFAYKVATGAIPQKTKLNQVPLAQIRELFAGDARLRSLTVEGFFKGPRFAKRAAIGSLLHMIQDSYALGHAQRKILDYTTSGKKVFARAEIAEFHCYTNQDEDLHAKDDKWPEGLEKVNPAGDLNPISVGAQILRFMYANDGDGAPWADVEKYLREVVFAVPNRNALSGPGERYRKSPSTGER